MIDYFALLDEPRRPWPDLESLRSRFLARSAEVHPDRQHQADKVERETATQRYAELNAAYHCLREPKDRLQHLLLVERGARPIGIESVPAELMDLFMGVGSLCREVDAFLAERSKLTSPLLKVQLVERGLDWMDKLQRCQRDLGLRRAKLEGDLKQWNATWDAAPAVGNPDRVGSLPLAAVENAYRTLSYLVRWIGQLQERFVQLGL